MTEKTTSSISYFSDSIVHSIQQVMSPAIYTRI